MKRKLKLKSFVIPVIYTTTAFALVLSIFFMTKTLESNKEEELTYVSNAISEQEIPVISVEKVILRPYSDSNIKAAKYFYDYQSEQSKQENSLIYHENMYMQNSGVDYVLENKFDILAILDGTVMEVEDTELLGKTIKVRHDNDLISVYQSLSETSVKKDDTIKQGQTLGKSGTSILNSELKDHLHFELFHKGQVIDPEVCFDKKVSDL
ncbi:MAG: M23 family metallopeptidase [Bacilli bacterium]